MNIQEIKNSLDKDVNRIESLLKCYFEPSLSLNDKYVIDQEDKMYFKKQFGFEVPEKFITDYESAASSSRFRFHIDTIYLEGDMYASSHDYTKSLYSMLKNHQCFTDENYKYYEDSGDTHFKRLLLKGYLSFNYFMGIGYNILIHFTPNSYSLHMLFEDGQLCKLAIKNLQEYYELKCKTRGLYRWQAYLCEECPSSLKNTEYDGFFENMEQLFPEVDLSVFKYRDIASKQPSIASICKQYNYRKKFEDTFSNLPDSLKLNRRDPEWPVSFTPPNVQQTKVIEYHLGVKLPDAFKAFYWQMDGFYNIIWNAQTDNYVEKNQFANFAVYTLEQMFGRLANDEIAEEHIMNAAKDYEDEFADLTHLENKYIFYRDTGYELLLEFPEDRKLKVWLLNLAAAEEYELEYVTDNLDEVLEKLLKYRGMMHWPIVGTEYFEYFAYKDEFISNVKAFFPDADDF